MSAVVLAEIAPRAAATGATTTVRLCWNARERANFLGQQWLPAITSLPEFETVLGYDGSRFGAGASPTVGQLQFALSAENASLAGMVWKGAAITLRRAAWRAGKLDPVDGDFSTIWSGRIDTATVDSGIVTVTMIDAGDVLRRPVIDRRFGTSGVAVLDAAAAVAQKGKPVPMGWGRLEGVPCLLLDSADLIYLVLGQAADSVSAFYDGGAAFTLGTARADLAALRANVPVAGRVDYCLSAGGLCLARPWTRPVYPFTADLRSGTATASAIAQALVSTRTTLGFVAGALAALTTAQASDCGLYVEDDTVIAAALDRLLAGIGAVWSLTAAGQIDVRQVTASGTSTLTVASWARGAVRRQRLVMPQRRFTLGYKPNWRVHSDGEIAQALLAGDVLYADGTPIEALKPAQSGATAGAPAGTNVGGVPATTLVSDAAIAKSNAATALSQISNITSDSVLDKSEKPEVVRQWEAIAAEQSTFNVRATAFGITTENTTYSNAISALATYLNSLSPFWYDSSSDTPIVRSTFIGKFNDVYYARQLLADRIALVASQRANLMPGNDVVDSEFTRGIYAFRFSANTFAGPVLPVNGGVNLSASWSGIRNVMWATVATGGANWNAAGLSDPFTTRGQWIAGNVADQRAFGMPVKAGDNVYARCLLARHRCTTQLYLLVFDKDGTLLEAPSWTGGRVDGAAGGNPANFDVVGGTYVVTNPNAATAQLMWRMLSTNLPDPYIFMTEPAMGILPAYQTTLPPYQSGKTDPLADVTGQNTALNTTNVAGVGAGTLISNVDAKARTFNQTTAPSSPQIGWLWTVPGENAQRRWNGSVWELTLVATGSVQVEASLAVPTSGSEQVLFDQTLGVGPSGTVIVSGDINYSPSTGLGAASVQLELAAYYRTTPGSGSWTLMGTAQAGSMATRADDLGPGEPGEVTPGAVVLSRSLAGPGSITNWQFQIRGRVSGGSGGAQGGGTGRVRWS